MGYDNSGKLVIASTFYHESHNYTCKVHNSRYPCAMVTLKSNSINECAQL